MLTHKAIPCCSRCKQLRGRQAWPWHACAVMLLVSFSKWGPNSQDSYGGHYWWKMSAMIVVSCHPFLFPFLLFFLPLPQFLPSSLSFSHAPVVVRRCCCLPLCPMVHTDGSHLQMSDMCWQIPLLCLPHQCLSLLAIVLVTCCCLMLSATSNKTWGLNFIYAIG